MTHLLIVIITTMTARDVVVIPSVNMAHCEAQKSQLERMIGYEDTPQWNDAFLAECIAVGHTS